MSSWRKDLNRLVRDRGLSITLTGSGHFRITKPGCTGSVICSFSPKNPWRSMLHLRTQLRKVWGDDE